RSAVAIRMPAARKHHHIANALLKAGSIFSQYQHGPGRPISNDAYRRPYINSFGDPISPRRNEDDALFRRGLNLVDGLLNRSAVVRDSISVNRKFVRR